MRKPICLALGLISLAMLVRLSSSPAPPEIEFLPAVIDLGEVREQQQLSTEFAIRNNAKVEYTITNILTACRCTANQLTWPQTLAPSETLSVPIEYQVGRGDGTLTQRLVVLLERTAEPGTLAYAKPIEIVSRVIPELRATPRQLDFGRFGPDDGARFLSFRIEPVGGGSYRIEAVEVTAPAVRVEHPPLVGTLGADFRVEFTPANVYSSRSMRGAINIALSGGTVDSISVPFKAAVVPPFVASPDVLVFHQHSRIGSVVPLSMQGCEPFRVAEVRLPESIVVQDQAEHYATNHLLDIVLSELATGPLGHVEVALVGQSGRRGKVVVPVSRVPDEIGVK